MGGWRKICHRAELPSFTLPPQTLSPPGGAGGGSVQFTPVKQHDAIFLPPHKLSLNEILTFNTFVPYIGDFPATTNQTLDSEILHTLVIFKIHSFWCTWVCCVATKLISSAIIIWFKIHALWQGRINTLNPFTIIDLQNILESHCTMIPFICYPALTGPTGVHVLFHSQCSSMLS